jgi:hypothetical protein
MKTSASTLGLALLGSSLLLGLLGCTVEAKTSKEYLGSQVTQTLAYTAGKDVSIDGVNGAIQVVPGAAGNVSVTFSPFSIRGSGEDQEAIADMQNNLTMSAATDANGNVVVTTGRSGGTTGLGAKIQVAIPPELTGKLSVSQGNGNVTVDTAQAATQVLVDDNGAGSVTTNCGSAFAGEIRIQNEAGDVNVGSVGSATLVEIQNTGTGNCVLSGYPTITNSTVHCGWDISVSNVSDHVDILSTNPLGDAKVVVTIAGISDTTSGGSVTLTAGLVSLTMPATESYGLQAQAFGGTVDLGTPPATCNVTVASAGSKSMGCTSATPLYTVVAGDQTGNVGNITVGYH